MLRSERLVVAEELAQGDSEGVGDVDEGVEGDAGAAVFEGADAAGVDAYVVAEGALGEALGFADVSDAFTDAGSAADRRLAGRSVGHPGYADGFMIQCRCS